MNLCIRKLSCLMAGISSVILLPVQVQATGKNIVFSDLNKIELDHSGTAY